MDQQIQQFIERLTIECMKSNNFNTLPQEQWEKKLQEIREYFYSCIMTILIDNMDSEQLEAFNSLDFASPEASSKIEELAAGIPGFAVILEAELTKQANEIKATGKIPQETT